MSPTQLHESQQECGLRLLNAGLMTDKLPDGRWVGFYRHNWMLLWRKGAMELDLNFEDGIISGRGTDPVGSFTILGHYHLEYEFVKQYAGRHSVHYTGRPNGRGLAGRWQIPNNWGGDFEIWPV